MNIGNSYTLEAVKREKHCKHIYPFPVGNSRKRHREGVIQAGVILTPKQKIIDTQLYFVRFSVFVESKEIFQKFHSYKTMGILNDVKKHTLSCYVNILG